MSRNLIIIAVLFFLAIISNPGSVWADDDYMEARRLQNSGEIMDLQTILESIKSLFPGRILEIDLEKENGDIVYEVEILGADGIVKEIYINARNGQLINIKEDD